MKKKLSFCSLCILSVLTVLVLFSVGSLHVSASYELEDLDIFWFNEEFYDVSEFVDGYASFTYDGRKYGIIDLQGNVLLEPTYDRIFPFSGDYAVVMNGRLSGVINKKIQLVSPMKSTYVKDDRLIRVVFEGYSIFVFYNNKVGMINQSKKVVIPPKFDEIQLSDFSDHLVMAKDNKGYYFFDREGKLVFQIICDDLYHFENGMAIFRVGKNYGLIDQKFNMVLEPKYADLDDFSEGLVAFAQREKLVSKWGFLDLSGKIVIPAKYDRVWPFKNGVSFGKLNDKIVAFDKKGKVLKTFVDYEEVESFTDHLYQFIQLKGIYFRKGLLDRNFNEILPAKYSQISPFSEGLSRIVEIEDDENEKERHGFIDKNGKFVIPLIFESAEDFYEGIAVVKLNGRYGRIKNPLIDSDSKKLPDSKEPSDSVKDSKPMNSKQKEIYSKVDLQQSRSTSKFS